MCYIALVWLKQIKNALHYLSPSKMLVRIPFSKVSSKRHRAPNLQIITSITLNTNLNNVIEI